MYSQEILDVRRFDYPNRTLITLVGEVDLASVSAVREALVGCLSDGVSVIDVDMSSVAFCDCLGLGVFLHASRKARRAGGSLRLHDPAPQVARLISWTRIDAALLAPPNPAPRRGSAPTRRGPAARSP